MLSPKLINRGGYTEELATALAEANWNLQMHNNNKMMTRMTMTILCHMYKQQEIMVEKKTKVPKFYLENSVKNGAI